VAADGVPSDLGDNCGIRRKNLERFLGEFFFKYLPRTHTVDVSSLKRCRCRVVMNFFVSLGKIDPGFRSCIICPKQQARVTLPFSPIKNTFSFSPKIKNIATKNNANSKS